MKYLLIASFVLMSAQAFAGGDSSCGPGNPASVNCKMLGGKSELVTEPNGGQYANCVIEEWKLYRAMDERGLVKRHEYPGVGMPNPASVNCADLGGTLRIKKVKGGEAGFCAVEEWSLWRVINVTNN